MGKFVPVVARSAEMEDVKMGGRGWKSSRLTAETGKIGGRREVEPLFDGL